MGFKEQQQNRPGGDRGRPAGETRYPILVAGNAEPRAFVAFWDRLYTGYDEEFYIANVGQPLTPQRIADWFKWKNGTLLSPRKARSILRYSRPEEQLAADVDEAAVEAYLKRPGGAVWRMFYLHLQHPARWPIYDQHVHRAMATMQGWMKVEIPSHDPTKVRTYLREYVPFFHTFAGIDPRQVDRALWAFGKFVGSYGLISGLAQVGESGSAVGPP